MGENGSHNATNGWIDGWVAAMAHCGGMHHTLDLQKQLQWQVHGGKVEKMNYFPKNKSISEFQNISLSFLRLQLGCLISLENLRF